MAELSPMSRFAADFPSHVVDVDDVFFSMTDGRGIIRQVNDVFVRLSRYSRADLIGAAHNVIRHPEMPGGVFRTMWETLAAGRPFAGYIRNRSRGDSTYDTLATVTPLPDGGYLSVRIPPLTEHFDVVRDIYYQMNDLEHWKLNEGASRPESAEAGAQRLAEELAARGFSSYEQMQWEILPAELEERERRSAGLPAIDGSSGAHAELLEELHGVYRELDDFMAALQEIVELTAALEQAGRKLEEETTAVTRVSGEMDRMEISGPERTLLLAPLQAWLTMQSITTEYITELLGLLEELRQVGARTRFHIALARLHTTMAATFTAGLPGEPDAEEPAVAAIPPLIEALRVEVNDTAEQVRQQQRLSRHVKFKVRSVMSIMSVPRDVLASWLRDTDFECFSEDSRQLVEETHSTARGASAAIGELETLSARLAGECELNAAGLRSRVDRVAQATAGYLG